MVKFYFQEEVKDRSPGYNFTGGNCWISKESKESENNSPSLEMDSGEVIANIAAPELNSEGSSQATPRYQVSKVNLGKQTKWEEIDTLVATTSNVQSMMEK